MPRYIIADPDEGMGWGHIFSEREGERIVRFVYDTRTGKLTHLDIYNTFGPLPANAAEIADVEDSLKNANEDALKDPDYLGIIGSDELPEWAAQQGAPRP